MPQWNEANLFTGWADVELTTLGKNEAAGAATQLWREGITLDVAYTSRLKRAQQTLDIVLKITGQEDLQVRRPASRSRRKHLWGPRSRMAQPLYVCECTCGAHGQPGGLYHDSPP